MQLLVVGRGCCWRSAWPPRLFGVVFAAVQTDMKRLLAYSSIENIGLLFVGIGLTLVFAAYGMQRAGGARADRDAVPRRSTTRSSRACCSSAPAAVLHATGERNLGKLGGLIRTMPWVGVARAGRRAGERRPAAARTASSPNGCCCRASCSRPGCPSSLLNMLVPVVAALIALVAALAGYMMVKFFGVIFLGQPREDKLAQAHDAGALGARRHGLARRSAASRSACFRSQFIQLIDPVTRQLVGDGLGPTRRRAAAGCWRRSTIERASYGPVIFLLGVAASFALAFLLVRRLYHGRLRRAPPWDCGFPWQTARMQDTAEGFGQPIRQIFEPFFRMQRELPSPVRRAAALPRRRSRTTSGTGSTCRSRAWPSASSRVDRPAAAGPHLRSTCSTASSR